MEVRCSLDISTENSPLKRLGGKLFEPTAHGKEFMMLCFDLEKQERTNKNA